MAIAAIKSGLAEEAVNRICVHEINVPRSNTKNQKDPVVLAEFISAGFLTDSAIRKTISQHITQPFRGKEKFGSRGHILKKFISANQLL